MDTRDCEPGVPTSEALLVVERLILDKKVNFIVGGPIRTEAYHAAMDLFSKYKIISIVNTGVYSPTTAKKIAEKYDQYKYSFRVTGHVGAEITLELPALLKDFKDKLGFDKIYILVQDVAHARKSGELVEALAPKWGWKVARNEGISDWGGRLLIGTPRCKRKRRTTVVVMDGHARSFYSYEAMGRPSGSCIAYGLCPTHSRPGLLEND